MKKIIYATCQCCEATDVTENMVSIPSPKRGGRLAYMCERCATTNRLYHSQSNKVLTTPKANGLVCGIELETSYTDEQARVELFQYGMIPTHDCSLKSDSYGWYRDEHGRHDGSTCEYVSGKMYGLNQVSKLCLSVEKLINNHDLRINNSCGTHFHISINNMMDEYGNSYMPIIREYFTQLFMPLSNIMKEHKYNTIELYGRHFNSKYAWDITRYSQQVDSHDDRYYFINCMNDNRIEFRINKFINAKQYQKLIKFEVEMVKIIIKNFCSHYNEEPKDKRRYKDIESYRKHKAEITANKIVQLYYKYITSNK